MWFPIVAWIVLLIAAAFFAGATLDLDPAQISTHFSALPGPQRFALGAIIFTTISLIVICRANVQSLTPKQVTARTPQGSPTGDFGCAWIAERVRRGGPESRRQ